MTYKPRALSESDSSFALNVMWFGLAGSLLLLAAKVFGFFEAVDGIAGGVTAGSLTGLVFFGRQDEYAQRLIATASAWACAVVGLWLFLSVISFTDQYVTDHVLGLVIVATTFHVTFAIARLRGS